MRQLTLTLTHTLTLTLTLTLALTLTLTLSQFAHSAALDTLKRNRDYVMQAS